MGISCFLWMQNLSKSDWECSLQVASEAVCSEATNQSHLQASWSVLQYNVRSRGLCCLIVPCLLRTGNSCWFMAVSTWKRHPNHSWESSVTVIDGHVNRIVVLLLVTPAPPSPILIDHSKMLSCLSREDEPRASCLSLSLSCNWGITEYP